ncbi:MAG: addiction module protein [Proteobacteria bacterium]|nr:addiction module protein [Pseudomonadota bacterium]MBU4469330.1 addiction module protein [Pseudomonadota bacterium]MCG2750808.1 addiction module protein [Desulfobacteraceae bacterium]
MATSADKIYDQALDLPIDARLALIDKLLQSTNLPIQSEIDQIWANEVELRSQSLNSRKSKLIPGELVFKKIKKRFSE